MRKFTEDANNSNLGFIPIVFEITGKMHPVTRDLLHQFSAKGKTQGCTLRGDVEILGIKFDGDTSKEISRRYFGKLF